EGEVKQVVDKARGIEGLIRQPGVHAAGVIMSAEPLTDHIPVWTRHADGAVITQFDYPTCEGLGLLKMDFLGLRNLTIMADAVALIKSNRGTEIDLLRLPLDDKPTYDLLGRGDTLGVFQLDGGPMRALLRSMKPDNFEDISAVGALYRPGPMGANSHNEYADRKNGRKPVIPIHPELAEPLSEILGDTYGLIVYQEQDMAALLTTVGDDKDKSAVYLAECRNMGITVLPPDVNASEKNFSPVGTDIRFGLSAIRNVGSGAVASLIATRKAKGDFSDFSDF